MPSERSTYKQNLPAAISSFIGREHELREIGQRLRNHRLITLTGMGGAGKTRLALEAAAGELDQFADGVWLVEFAGLFTSDLLAETIAKVLASPETSDRAPIERLGAFLEARHLLLVLELASARVSVLTVQEIAARLNDQFALLTAGQRSGLAPRHQTLRAAIDWSCALLTAEEQTLLRRLAVFAAGFAFDTAEAVCSGEGLAEARMLDVLSSLVAKSLVVAETTSRAQARYRLLETIREYALSKLDAAGEAARLRDRHLDVFLARAEAAAPKLFDAYQQLWLKPHSSAVCAILVSVAPS
jgi:predicted ATPase